MPGSGPYKIHRPGEKLQGDTVVARPEIASEEEGRESPLPFGASVEGESSFTVQDAERMRMREESERAEQLRRMVGETSDSVDLATGATAATRAIDTAAKEMRGYHDPRWKKVIADHKRKESYHENVLKMVEQGNYMYGDPVTARRGARYEREFVRQLEERVAQYALRDQFFDEALADYQGIGTAVLGTSASERREIRFLESAVKNHSVSVREYLSFLEEEKDRVSGDRSLGFIARKMRGARLAHRLNVAQMFVPREEKSAERKISETVSSEEQVVLTQTPTKFKERALAEVKWDEVDTPTAATQAIESPSTIVPAPEKQPIEPKPSKAEIQIIDEDSEESLPPEHDAAILMSKELAALESEGIAPPPLLVEEPRERVIQSLLSPKGWEKLPLQKRRRQKLLDSLLGKESTHFSRTLQRIGLRERLLTDQFQNDHKGALPSEHSDSAAWMFSSHGEDFEPLQDQLIEQIAEVREDRMFLEELRLHALRIMNAELDAVSDVGAASRSIRDRIGATEQAYRSAALQEHPDFAFIAELARRIIELRLALQELEAAGEDTFELPEPESPSSDDLQEDPSEPESVQEDDIELPEPEAPSRDPLFSRLASSRVGKWVRGLGMVIGLLTPTNRAPIHESFPRMEEIEELAPLDEPVEYKTRTLYRGGNVWSEAEKMMQEAGVKPTNERLVFLSRVVLDGNKISDAHKIPKGTELDYTRAAKLIAEMKQGAQVKDLARAAGYQGEVRI